MSGGAYGNGKSLRAIKGGYFYAADFIELVFEPF